MKPVFRIIFLFVFITNNFAADEKPLKLDEVLSVIRSNMVDSSEAELSNSAALGLIRELGTKVQLVNSAVTNEAAAAEFPDPISKVTVYEKNFGYVRVKNVDERLADEFKRRITQLLSSNKVAGLIIDLRFAGGTNYQAAARVAETFANAGEPLVKLGDEQLTAKAPAAFARMPIAVLVNGETTAAAEALAGILREAAAALLIGGKTAGEARLYEVFTLSTGHKLRVGKVPVIVGRAKAIPSSGVVPDIEVKISPEEDGAFYQDPFRERTWYAESGRTNEFSSFIQSRPRSEAELVRRHRNEDREMEEAPAVVRGSAEVTVITDPTLARALDFLKGISIWQPRR